MAWQIFCMLEPKKKAREARMRSANAKRKVSPISLHAKVQSEVYADNK